MVRGLSEAGLDLLCVQELWLEVSGRKVHTGFSDHYGVAVEILGKGS